MGGFTSIQLRDVSQENIDAQNNELAALGLAKQYRFYSPTDVALEYQYYLKGDGNYPDHLFPKHRINSFEDFKRYWSTEALGETFVPRFGMLTFDCYFGRMSQRAMKTLGRYLANNIHLISAIEGSLPTFVERGMTKGQAKKLSDNGFEF